ncbi:MAG: beta-ketoacyl synthase N-terminal-like domain-containing protein, partial [Pseudomonadota bacterium]
MSKRRVVVTGLGMVSPLGLTVQETWSHLLAGKSGVSRVESFDVSDYSAQISASVKGFDPSEYMPLKDARKLDTFVQYGFVAAKEAIHDAGLDIAADNLDLSRVGIAIGSGIGGLPGIEKAYS